MAKLTDFGYSQGMNGISTADLRSLRSDRGRAFRAFTLIELLVVVAIIGVLASMTFPGIQMALSYARATTCTSNLRQIGMGLTAYASDAEGVIPPHYLVERVNNTAVFFQASVQAGVPTHYWYGALIGILDDGPNKASKVYSCPASNFPKPSSKGWGMSYAYNGSGAFWNRTTVLTSNQQFGFQPEAIANPSGCVLIGERWAAMADGSTALDGWGVVPPWDAARPAMTSPLHGGGNPNALRISHRGRSNYLFLDNHVESQGPWDRVAPTISAATESSTTPNMWCGR